jgi:acetate kinase
MTDAILAVNAGSSNVKIGVYDYATLDCKKRMRLPSLDAALDAAARLPFAVTAVGHRIVHGGEEFAAPTKLTPDVEKALRALAPLAPLHQPAGLAAVARCRELWPEAPQIACFDTAFHRTHPWRETRIPLPPHITEGGVRRYGFHGISYGYVASVLPDYAGDAARGRAIVAHLGGGASMCAMKELKSVASTMGFSALDGLMMGTRCGALDPGVVLHLLKSGMTVEEAETLLYRESGLKGVSGIGGDMRELTSSPDPRAREAVELFCYLAAKQLGGLLTALGGMDALAFTGGVGERSAAVRAEICGYLAWLGVRIDAERNGKDAPRIDAPGGAVPVCVVPTDEEAVLAQACREYPDAEG